MRTYFLSTLLITLFSFEAFAARATCSGTYRGTRIDFWANGSITNTRDGNGALWINGREAARFQGDDLRLNMFTKSFQVSNSRGDRVKGRLINVGAQTGVLNELIIPSLRINFVNVPVRCQVH